MSIAAKTEYACIAVMALARSYGSGQPIRVGAIAERHEIPSRFLVQILLQLKSAGLVSSTRGASGGYQLVRDPATISLADVVEVLEGPLCESGDIFTQEEGGFVCSRPLPAANVGDFLVIECAGAYGFVMSSNYNSKPISAEVLIQDAKPHLVRKRQSFSDLFADESIPSHG